MDVSMSDIGERLATIENNQRHADKRMDKLVEVVEMLTKNQSDIAIMNNEISAIKKGQEKTDSNIEKLADRVSQIDKNALQNKTRIAMISAAISGTIGFIMWFFKSKIN